MIVFGKDGINHCLNLANLKKNKPDDFDPEVKAVELTSAMRNLYYDLSHNFKVEFDSEGSYKIVASSDNSDIVKGFIIGKNLDKDVKTYTEFYPIKFSHLQMKEFLSFDSYNRTVDEFYSKLELQKSQQSANANEKKAMKKLSNIKKDQEERIISLKTEQTKCARIAEIIRQNNDLVNEAILMINHAIANQVSWDMIRAMVTDATDQGNPIAAAIEEIAFEKNQITLRLFDIYEDSDEENDEHSLPDGSYLVTISLDKNAMTNASSYYDRKKAAVIKEEKTLEASRMVMKKTEKKVKREVHKLKDVKKVSMNRKMNWFEKFYWFISSENYLVLAGRDATQNDMLFKKYFNKDDIFIHANTRGSSAVIVKNRSLTPEELVNPVLKNRLNATCGVPIRTLLEAGSMAVCLSSAWTSKILTDAWWVTYDQVSKTAPSGEYLPAGSFMIRGKKNFLNPNELIHGFGIMFKLSPESVLKNHQNERRITVDDECEQDPRLLNAIQQGQEKTDSTDTTNDDDHNCQPTNLTTDTKGSLASAYPDVKVKIDLTKKPEIQQPLVSVTGGKSASSFYTQKSYNRPNNTTTFPTKNTASDKANVEKENATEKPAKRGQKGKTKMKRMNKDQDEWKILEKNVIEKLAPLKGLSHKEDEDDQSQEEAEAPTQNEEIQACNTVEEPSEICEDESRLTVKVDDQVGDSSPGSDDEDVKIINKRSYNSIELDLLDSFTGCPKPDDEIMYAIPICAPYMTINKWKYKIKFTPGQTKRGPAVNSARHHFIHQKDANELEQDMIRVLKDEDCVRFMLNLVNLNIGKNVKR